MNQKQYSFSEMSRKTVINVADGRELGHVCDMLFNNCGGILGFVVPGKKSFFKSITSSDSIFIPWNRIIKIGSDVILTEMVGSHVSAFGAQQDGAQNNRAYAYEVQNSSQSGQYSPCDSAAAQSYASAYSQQTAQPLPQDISSRQTAVQQAVNTYSKPHAPRSYQNSSGTQSGAYNGPASAYSSQQAARTQAQSAHGETIQNTAASYPQPQTTRAFSDGGTANGAYAQPQLSPAQAQSQSSADSAIQTSGAHAQQEQIHNYQLGNDAIQGSANTYAAQSAQYSNGQQYQSRQQDAPHSSAQTIYHNN